LRISKPDEEAEKGVIHRVLCNRAPPTLVGASNKKKPRKPPVIIGYEGIDMTSVNNKENIPKYCHSIQSVYIHMAVVDDVLGKKTVWELYASPCESCGTDGYTSGRSDVYRTVIYPGFQASRINHPSGRWHA
jgi:hypothetical protein